MPARDLFRQIAHSAWECADPGLQFDTTINRWHTAPNTGRINGSNPCSEYVHLDNSACNLASMNLLTFLDENDEFDVEGFKAAVAVVFTGQEIIVGNADYPTEKIGETTRAFRQLGIGYANLGALLMAQGLPYDSDAGRAWAAAITALLTGHAYATSARTAARMGPFAGYHENAEPMLNVLRMHQAEAARIDEDVVPPELLSAAQESWDQAVDLAEAYGVRNSQASVLAPTGTIGLLMDCDTTGVEPDLGLVKTKKLVGGGTMSIVNQTVPRALAKLGYGAEQVEDIVAYINEHMSIVGAPHLAPEHLPVFACSMGDNTIHYSGHIRMMGAVQPFISGAISKTVNMPEDVTRRGRRAAAHRRLAPGHQGGRHLPRQLQGGPAAVDDQEGGRGRSRAATRPRRARRPRPRTARSRPRIAELEAALAHERQRAESPVVVGAVRERLPRKRNSKTFSFRVADCEGYVTVGEYEDGRPGEVFIKVSKQGSTLAGIMDAFSISHQPRAPARRAAGDLRAQVRQHEVRAGRHHRRPRAAHRHEPGRLHLPPAGARLPVRARSGPSSASSPRRSARSRRCPASRRWRRRRWAWSTTASASDGRDRRRRPAAPRGASSRWPGRSSATRRSVTTAATPCSGPARATCAGAAGRPAGARSQNRRPARASHDAVTSVARHAPVTDAHASEIAAQRVRHRRIGRAIVPLSEGSNEGSPLCRAPIR